MSSTSIDDLSRTATLLLGLVATALGVATIVAVDPFVGVLPSSFALAGLAGVLAFLAGLWMARQRYRGGVTEPSVPNVELPLALPAPGADIDQALYNLVTYREGTTEYRERIHDRLQSVAVAVVRQRESCSREEAIEMLEAGTWTDHEFAANYFSGGSPPGRSLRERLFGDDRSAYGRWVELTVDAIVDKSGVDVAQTADTEEEPGGLLDGLRSDDGSDDDQGGVTPEECARFSDYEDAELVADGVLYKDPVATGHWRGISAFALIAAGWGVVTFQPSILLVSVVAIGAAAFARSGSSPPLAALDVERELSDETPQPGEVVDVTVTLHNAGGSFLPDLRVVDLVPEPMTVVEGSPRLATSLGADSRASFSYRVVAERGTHQWPTITFGRDFSASVEREASHRVDATMECAPELQTTSEMPVRSQTSLFSGEVSTDVGGSGLEFFAVREYREGDPMNRIDWKRHARTGELATIDFRLERAAQVALLFDARSSAYVAPAPGERHALDRSVDAAMEVFSSLYERGDLVGLAAFDTVPCWLGPSAGDAHNERARRIFTEHTALTSIPPQLKDVEGPYVDPMVHVRRQLSPEAQVMLFSPLCSEYSAEVARRLDSMGHLVTVVSPDPTASETVGQRLTRVERAMRVSDLREHGIRVVDWSYDEVLGLELERAQQRWAV